MQDRTTIINSALMRCGANGINLAFQDTPAAQAASAVWQRSLDFCLTLYPWPFAMRLMPLARNAEGAAFGYRYAYGLPGDCVRVVDIWLHDAEGKVSALSRVQGGPRFAVAGRSVCTDAEGVALRYVSNNRDLSFPDTFADALSWRLCVEMAPYIEQGNSVKTWFELFEQALDRAKVEADAQDFPVMEAWPSRILQERRVD